MELKGDNAFKICGFGKGGGGVEEDDGRVCEIDDVLGLGGIGKGRFGVMSEYMEKGE
ncbi:hypothetical protein [Bacillus pumilus]|uniref:hypothetical protein n=1 Tax=Bacillus pumilus TaxID=1408 RepID=UPI00164234AF|nr:hypothetical protein [Bacillus pumilus]